MVLLGEGRVGKTSTVLRYVHDKFDDKCQATIQASFLSKRLSVAGENVSIAIWVRHPLLFPNRKRISKSQTAGRPCSPRRIQRGRRDFTR